MAEDLFHDAVKNALVKEGWTITDDPLRLQSFGVTVLIDLGAEISLGAMKDGRKIAVEIKTFISISPISQFHTALGQFLNYRDALEDKEPDRTLFLAIPSDVYESTFEIPFIRRSTEKYQLALLVYDADEEIIEKWQPAINIHS